MLFLHGAGHPSNKYAISFLLLIAIFYFLILFSSLLFSSPASPMGESKTLLFPSLLYSHGKGYSKKTFISSSIPQSSSIRALKTKTKVVVLGSSHGWLILKETPNYKTAAHFYSLWNPITFESIDFLPFNSKPEHVIMSFILSSPPSDDDPNSMLLLFEAGIPAIFAFRISNPEWIELRYGNSSHQKWVETSCGIVDEDYLHSPVSYDGKVFATQRTRRNLIRVEIKHDNTLFLQPLIDLPRHPPPHSYYMLENLVECCGELYTVYCIIDGSQEEIVAVHVFKLNFSGMTWDKVDNIDNHAFFVTDDIAISCSATTLSSFPTHKNFIYFTIADNPDKELFAYHVEDGTLTVSHPCPDNLPTPWISPIWVTLPTLGTNIGEHREETLKALVFSEETKDSEKNVLFPWTNLPMDLQTLIAKKLSPFDYMEFRSICRMNRLIAPSIQWRTKLAGSNKLHLLSPCLIYSPSGKNVCNILDPNLNGKYLVKTPEYFQDPVVRCCKGSWLLMSELRYSTDLWMSMFLFNPFTKVTIRLPNMRRGCAPALRFSLTSFNDSSGPCYIVCFLNLGKKANFLVTYPAVDAEWTLLVNTDDFYATDNVPVFLNNNLYYSAVEAKLGVLTLAEERWSWEVWDVQGRPDDFQHNYLVECNRKLLSVFVGDTGKWVKVFKLCKHDSGTSFRLEPVLDLGKYALYLSRLSTICKVAELEGTGNRIYFERLYQERAIFYSLDTLKFHTSDGKDSLTNYYNTSEALLCAWIQPNWCDLSHNATKPVSS